MAEKPNDLMPEEEKEKRDTSEQRAQDLLEGLRDATDRARRVQVLVALLGAASFVFAMYLLFLNPFWLPGRVQGAPVDTHLITLCGLMALGVSLFLAKGFVERGDRIYFKRETTMIVEEILQEDPKVEKRFNREIITAIYQEILYE